MNRQEPLIDRHGRRITYLRVSVTDRCNMRCVYCMPQDAKFLPPEEILSLEEITRIVGVGVGAGIKKVRLTGGEPLAWRDILKLIRNLAQMPELDEISLTTNGLLLGEFAEPLARAGLHRINVSLDTLQPDKFRAICRKGELEQVLGGIDAAGKVGLQPVKINVVVIRGANDDELEDFVCFSMERGVIVRFIEYMPFSKDKDWESKLVAREEILERIRPHLADLRETGDNPHAPARYFKDADGNTPVGLISPVSHGFCSNCNRLRLTSGGGLRGCLLSEEHEDMKDVLRSGGSDSEIADVFRHAVLQKGEKGEFHRITSPMHKIGG